jgi:hypothetical protein
MSDEPKKRPRAWIGWTLFALCFLYPLSLGPALAITIRENSDSARATYDAVYQPLWRVCERCRPINDALMWYCAWWDDRFPQP